jgi:hypothetical protein
MPGLLAQATKWLCLAAALALAVYGYVALQRARDIREVMVNGSEVGALVEGGPSGVYESFNGSKVDLAWVDVAGATQKARGLWINDALAKQVREGGPGAETLMIKYLAGRPPVIVRQAAHDQERNATEIVRSISAAGVAAVIGAFLFWLDRRRAS